MTTSAALTVAPNSTTAWPRSAFRRSSSIGGAAVVASHAATVGAASRARLRGPTWSCLTAPRAAQHNRVRMRALEPEVQGRVEVDGVGIGYEVFGVRPGHDRVHAGVGDRQLALLEGPGPVPRAALPRDHLRRAPAAAAPTARRIPALYSRDVRDTLAVLDATGTERALSSGSRSAPPPRCSPRRCSRSASPAWSRSARPSRSSSPGIRGRRSRSTRTPARRGLGALHPRLVAARLPGLRRVLLREMLPRAALREADRGLRRLGPRRRPRGARARRWTRRPAIRRARRSRRCSPACAARCSRIHGDDDRISPLARGRPGRRADRRRARRPRGLGHAPPRATRSGSTPDRRVRGDACSAPAAPRAALDAGARAGRARAARLLADRPRPRAARPRDRARAAGASCPASRSTGSPSIRSPRRSRRRASACTRRAGGWLRVGHLEARRGPSTRCRLPGHPRDGRDPRRQLHGLPRRRARDSPTTCGSATRRGTSTTSCTRTRRTSARRSCS